MQSKILKEHPKTKIKLHARIVNLAIKNAKYIIRNPWILQKIDKLDSSCIKFSICQCLSNKMQKLLYDYVL